jgi:ornithine carbamoyltransferase
VSTVVESLKGRSFTKLADWSQSELEAVLDLADELKRARREGDEPQLLAGRTFGLLFLKPSTRTRVSLAAGIAQLGGTALSFSADDLQLARGETIRDTAVVLSRYLDGLVIRTFAQKDVEELALHATIPVVNALTDASHPCQILADLMTIRERRGRLEGLKLVYLGDGNNVCASLLVGAATFGMHAVAATPAAYAPPEGALAVARERAAASGGSVDVTTHVRGAVAGADVLYTDVWTSMGQEIVYGPQSAVFDEAENRLHTQKALLALIMP